MVVFSFGQVERERKRRDLDKQMLKENQKPAYKNGSQMSWYQVIWNDLILGRYVFVIHSHAYS